MLTKNQVRVYRFLTRYIASNAEAPTMREIGNQVGMSSSSSVYNALSVLESEGLIRRSRKHRGIELVDPHQLVANEVMIAGREG